MSYACVRGGDAAMSAWGSSSLALLSWPQTVSLARVLFSGPELYFCTALYRADALTCFSD